MFETQPRDVFSLTQFNFVTLCGLLGLFLGLILAVAGLIIVISEDQISANNEIESELSVHITGAVKTPGVYGLDPESILQDLVDKAGGFSDEVDQEYITQQLNLAQRVADGQKIYIPARADGNEVNTNSGDGGELLVAKSNVSSNGKTENPSAGLISINQASTSELETLTGVGAKRAEAIVAGRPYQTLEELLTKKIIGETVFKEILAQIKL